MEERLTEKRRERSTEGTHCPPPPNPPLQLRLLAVARCFLLKAFPPFPVATSFTGIVGRHGTVAGLGKFGPTGDSASKVGLCVVMTYSNILHTL